METKTPRDLERAENGDVAVLPAPNGSQNREPSPDYEHQFEDNSKVPKLGPINVFWLFLTRFGIFAWGGPVAQIALLKDELVVKAEWITIARFNRVFSVYQILPGPEAAELCMFFGYLAGGRIGGIAAGLGFILPGFLLMLLASYLYTIFGLGNIYVEASFRALQPMVAAMVSPPHISAYRRIHCLDQMFRAVHKISQHAFLTHGSKNINPWLIGYAFFTALNSALHINWLVEYRFIPQIFF